MKIKQSHESQGNDFLKQKPYVHPDTNPLKIDDYICKIAAGENDSILDEYIPLKHKTKQQNPPKSEDSKAFHLSKYVTSFLNFAFGKKGACTVSPSTVLSIEASSSTVSGRATPANLMQNTENLAPSMFNLENQIKASIYNQIQSARLTMSGFVQEESELQQKMDHLQNLLSHNQEIGINLPDDWLKTQSIPLEKEIDLLKNKLFEVSNNAKNFFSSFYEVFSDHLGNEESPSLDQLINESYPSQISDQTFHFLENIVKQSIPFIDATIKPRAKSEEVSKDLMIKFKTIENQIGMAVVHDLLLERIETLTQLSKFTFFPTSSIPLELYQVILKMEKNQLEQEILALLIIAEKNPENNNYVKQTNLSDIGKNDNEIKQLEKYNKSLNNFIKKNTKELDHLLRIFLTNHKEDLEKHIQNHPNSFWQQENRQALLQNYLEKTSEESYLFLEKYFTQLHQLARDL